jgi:hypothetical protein
MSDPLSLLNGVIQIITSLKDQYKRVNQNRFEAIISEITKKITEANIQISALLQKNLDLEKENQELLEDKRNPPNWDNGFYVDEETNALLCIACYDSLRKRHRLKKTGKDVSCDFFECPVCHEKYRRECPPEECERRRCALWPPDGRRYKKTRD